MNEFVNEIKRVYWSTFDQYNTDAALEYFYNILNFLVNKHMTLTKIRLTANNKNWIAKGIRISSNVKTIYTRFRQLTIL